VNDLIREKAKTSRMGREGLRKGEGRSGKSRVDGTLRRPQSSEVMMAETELERAGIGHAVTRFLFCKLSRAKNCRVCATASAWCSRISLSSTA
jgi:hypothetical protein